MNTEKLLSTGFQYNYTINQTLVDTAQGLIEKKMVSPKKKTVIYSIGFVVATLIFALVYRFLF